MSTPEPERSHRTQGTGTRTRQLALSLILETDGGKRGFIDEALETQLGVTDMEERDRHLLQEIAFGTVRHRNTLDLLLNRYVRFPMKRQVPLARWGLRLAAYQVIYLSRIPVHAAIDRTLEAQKGLGMGKRNIGFANAVLRRLADGIYKKTSEAPLEPHDPSVILVREGYCHFRDPILPLHTIDPVGHLALKHSHPPWLVQRWMERFGEEDAVQLLRANNSIPVLTARITAMAPDREEVLRAIQGGETPSPGGPVADSVGETGSIVLRRTGNPRKLEPLRRGWIQIQDPTATSIGEALEPPKGARVLDLCAAPGGKALQLLERLGPSGELVGCDVDEEKLESLKENLERAGNPFTLKVVPHDPEKLDLGEKFSHILLDAPCSNSGVLARRPEARWRIHREDLNNLAELQRKLLAAATRHLAPGGHLLYATCSIEPEENEEVVEWALKNLPSLRRKEQRTFLPHRDPGDGGYYALLESVSGAP